MSVPHCLSYASNVYYRACYPSAHSDIYSKRGNIEQKRVTVNNAAVFKPLLNFIVFYQRSFGTNVKFKRKHTNTKEYMCSIAFRTWNHYVDYLQTISTIILCSFQLLTIMYKLCMRLLLSNLNANYNIETSWFWKYQHDITRNMLELHDSRGSSGH